MKSCQLDASIIPASLPLVDLSLRQPMGRRVWTARIWTLADGFITRPELFSRGCVVTRGSHHVLPALLSPPAAPPDQDGGLRHAESSLRLPKAIPARLRTGLASPDTNRSPGGLGDPQTLLQLHQEFKFLHRQHPQVLQQADSPSKTAYCPDTEASREQTQTCSQDWRWGSGRPLEDNKRGPQGWCWLSSRDGARSERSAVASLGLLHQVLGQTFLWWVAQSC